jgi:hypothetical protein
MLSISFNVNDQDLNQLSDAVGDYELDATDRAWPFTSTKLRRTPAPSFGDLIGRERTYFNWIHGAYSQCRCVVFCGPRQSAAFVRSWANLLSGLSFVMFA